jgi:ABC-type proline/glycine betaine transport system permease subunit
MTSSTLSSYYAGAICSWGSSLVKHSPQCYLLYRERVERGNRLLGKMANWIRNVPTITLFTMHMPTVSWHQV